MIAQRPTHYKAKKKKPVFLKIITGLFFLLLFSVVFLFFIFSTTIDGEKSYVIINNGILNLNFKVNNKILLSDNDIDKYELLKNNLLKLISFNYYKGDEDISVYKIIGKSDDLIEYVNNTLYVNKKEIKDFHYPFLDMEKAVLVPKNKYFVISTESIMSSAALGLINKEQILGIIIE